MGREYTARPLSRRNDIGVFTLLLGTNVVINGKYPVFAIHNDSIIRPLSLSIVHTGYIKWSHEDRDLVEVNSKWYPDELFMYNVPYAVHYNDQGQYFFVNRNYNLLGERESSKYPFQETPDNKHYFFDSWTSFHDDYAAYSSRVKNSLQDSMQVLLYTISKFQI